MKAGSGQHVAGYSPKLGKAIFLSWVIFVKHVSCSDQQIGLCLRNKRRGKIVDNMFVQVAFSFNKTTISSQWIISLITVTDNKKREIKEIFVYEVKLHRNCPNPPACVYLYIRFQTLLFLATARGQTLYT